MYVPIRRRCSGDDVWITSSAGGRSSAERCLQAGRGSKGSRASDSCSELDVFEPGACRYSGIQNVFLPYHPESNQSSPFLSETSASLPLSFSHRQKREPSLTMIGPAVTMMLLFPSLKAHVTSRLQTSLQAPTSTLPPALVAASSRAYKSVSWPLHLARAY